VPAVAGLLGRGSSLNNLFLAHHEFADLAGPVDWCAGRGRGPTVPGRGRGERTRLARARPPPTRRPALLSASPARELVRRLGPRVAVIACPRDMWFPRAHYDELLSEVPGIQARQGGRGLVSGFGGL
jgi:hypothetical protein